MDRVTSFAVVIPAVRNAEEATRLADRIIAECGEPLVIAGHTVALRTSIDFALTDVGPNRVCEPGELLHRADLAMYAAKRRGDHGRVAYSAELTVPAVAQGVGKPARR